MENLYAELKEKHQKEFSKFPIKFAFSNEQFENVMREWGYTKEDTDKVVSVIGGGIVRKQDLQAFHDMFNMFDNEEKEARKSDKYLEDMFDYELANHEYGYTYDLEDTLTALGLTYEDIENDIRLSNALYKALSFYREEEG